MAFFMNKYSEQIIITAIVIISLPVIFCFSLISTDPQHAGFMFKSALDVSRGQILFKETFTLYGALTIWIHALFIKVFGEFLWAINLATAIFYSGAFVMLYLIGKRFMPKSMAFFSSILTFLMGNVFTMVMSPWSSVIALFFLLGSVYFLIVFAEQGILKYLILASVFTALVFWARQPVGIVAFAAWCLGCALLVYCKRKIPWKYFLVSFGAMAGVHLAFLLVIFMQGALRDWYIQSIESMLNFDANGEGAFIYRLLNCLFLEPFRKHSLSSVYGDIYDISRDCIYGILPVLCLFLFMLTFAKIIYYTVKKREVKTNDVLLEIYLLYCLASWHQYYPSLGHKHWYWAAFPMFIITVGIIYKGLNLFIRKQGGALRCLIAMLISMAIYAPNIIFRADKAYERIEEHNITMYHPEYSYTNGLKFNKEEIEFYTALYDYISLLTEMYPEKNIVNMTYDGFFATFSKYNAHPQFNDGTWTTYKNYYSTRDEYIMTQLPIIIGYDDQNDWWGLYEEYIELPGSMGNDWNPWNIIIQIPRDISVYAK